MTWTCMQCMQGGQTSQVYLVHVAKDELLLLNNAPNHSSKEASKTATYSARCSGIKTACVCISGHIGLLRIRIHAARLHVSTVLFQIKRKQTEDAACAVAAATVIETKHTA